jgi:hypothetical protein
MKTAAIATVVRAVVVGAVEDVQRDDEVVEVEGRLPHPP